MISIFIETILLVLIFTKSRYPKLSIIIWAAIALIIGFGLELIGDLLSDFNTNFESFKFNVFIYNISQLVIGILILDYTRRTVKIISNADSNRTLPLVND
jgi:hypothetical protein